MMMPSPSANVPTVIVTNGNGKSGPPAPLTLPTIELPKGIKLPPYEGLRRRNGSGPRNNVNVTVTVTGVPMTGKAQSQSPEVTADASPPPLSSYVSHERKKSQTGNVSPPVSGESGGSSGNSDSGICDNSEDNQPLDSDDEQEPVPGLSPEGGAMHCKIVSAFTRAFAKQNVHFEKAIQSLDLLNEQIISCVFSPESQALHKQIESQHGEAKYSEALKVSVGLMRRLLLDAQGKFRKMVEENKALAGRLDGDLQSAHRQMALLRAELSDTNKRISQLSSPPSSPSTPNHESSTTHTYPSTNSGTNHNFQPSSKMPASDDPGESGQQNGTNGIQSPNGLDDHDLEFIDSPTPVDLDSLSMADLRTECDKLLGLNSSLRKEIHALRLGKSEKNSSDTQTELQHAKEALSALKADRKRLKAEKFELLNQMKQLYATLEDKEKELRDFIRNYEQKMRESEASLQRLAIERDEAERERWNILRHARDEAERGLSLATQLNVREAQVQQMQQELHDAKRQLAQFGIYSEPDRSVSSTTNATSHYSLVSSLTATYATVGDRGSSADSGVRLSSDRDSGGGLPTASNLSDSATEGTYKSISLDLCGGDGSGDGDSMSVISTATLPQLFATPRDSPGPASYASYNRTMDSNTLSRSAEQLLAAEAAETRRKSSRRSGNDIAGRASAGAKGAWGSISRVFARNKHRRNLDPSIYETTATGQRSSWSPQSSVPQSPLTEQESYGDKLRALEEAATLPMELWRASMVQAWIEISLGMPQYGSRCADNIKSGKVLLELTDADLESELGISHPLHRKKLRLAIEEHRNPALVRFPCTIELSHVWVSSEWLPDIGLPQYAETFAGCLVDARLLDHLSKKDLEKYLGVTRKFHLASIAHGVHLLRIVAYDRQSLAERRRQCEHDPLVWTNHHFIQWARSIDLNEYADNLKGSGVHGAFAVLEPNFNGDTLASAMGIPPSKQIIRRHLNAELEALLNPARAKITQQYRTSKSRQSTASSLSGSMTLTHDKRGDSLGRSAALQNENFRRSCDDSRRRTSLRTYSLLVAQKGSLSRALGLKIKQDLLHKRQEEKEKAQEKMPLDYQSLLGPPPPLPPGPPGRAKGPAPAPVTNGKFNGGIYPPVISHPNNIGEHPLDDFTASILMHANGFNGHQSYPSSHSVNKVSSNPPSLVSGRPRSVADNSSSSPVSRHTDGEDGSSENVSDEKQLAGESKTESQGNQDEHENIVHQATLNTSNTAVDLSKKHKRGKSVTEIEHVPVHTPV